MQEKYRDRSGRIVALREDELRQLHKELYVIVDIGDQTIGFEVDGYGGIITEDVDRTLTLSPNEPERLTSGFISRFYSVLDTDGDGDLILEANERVDYEFDFTGQEYREIDTKDVLVDSDGREI